MKSTNIKFVVYHLFTFVSILLFPLPSIKRGLRGVFIRAALLLLLTFFTFASLPWWHGQTCLSVSTALAQPCPTRLGHTTGSFRDVFISGGLAYVAEGNGLIIFDVLNLANPLLIGRVDTPGVAIGVFVSGTTAYVADGSSGLQIFDVSSCACDSTNYGKGTSSITFKGGKKDGASLQMCVNRAFCDALRQNPKALSLRLDDCNEITIPGSKLKANKKKTKFSASSSTYTLVIDCKKGALSLRLKNVALKACVSNPVKMCVQIKDGLCLCAERVFVEKQDKKGNLVGLSLRVTRVCTP